MDTIKYPIKEIEIKTIPGNRILSLGITQTQKTLCEKNIRKHGLLTPIVLMENQSGELLTLAGEKELEVLKEMNVTKADVFIASIKDRSDTGKMILLLSSFQKGLDPLSEGILLKELSQTGGYSQKELSELLMKSKAWVCKRLSLVNKLCSDISEMVLSKQLCPASAQAIARLPKEVQHEFAMKVYSNNIPKSTVENLIKEYNSKKTPDTIKREIISDPRYVLNFGTLIKSRKCKAADQGNDLLSRFDSSLRIFIELICELEKNLGIMTKKDLEKYKKILPNVLGPVTRFTRLLEHYCGFPGKTF